MPRVFDPWPPSMIVLEVHGRRITLGPGGDLEPREVALLRAQAERWRMHAFEPQVPISKAHLEAILLVKEVFNGARIDDYECPTLPQDQRKTNGYEYSRLGFHRWERGRAPGQKSARRAGRFR